jgi:glucose-1-phosphate adenylyltransferase
MRQSRHPEQQTLALVLAGGSGTRLGPLTRWHAKPALPFGGQYRNIDFPLSNCVNSGIRRMALLTQYKSHSLIQHVQQGWNILRPEIGEFIELWPAQQRRGDGWYAGTADAVFQNLDLIETHDPRLVLVLAGDHIYKMDYRPMLDAHVASGAQVTVGCVQAPLEEARAFGVMSVDAQRRILRFDEKPVRPRPLPDRPDHALASMGIYVFDRDALLSRLAEDARNERSSHDFGHDVMPAMIGGRHALAFAFDDDSGEKSYWRDVGTVDSYWQANMDLLADRPALDLHDPRWPIRTCQPQCAPPRFVSEGYARRSVVSAGCVVAGAVEQSVLSTGSRLGAGSVVARSVILPGARVGRHCRIERAVIDSGCVVPDGTVIGAQAAGSDRHFVSAQGVTLVTAESLVRSGAGTAGDRRVA